MTSDQLIAEGRQLMRPSLFLRPQGSGPVAAIWYDYDEAQVDSTGQRLWLTVDARIVPGVPEVAKGCLSIFTDEEKCEGGRIEVAPSYPKRAGTALYAHEVSVLPPIDAVFTRGSAAVESWIRSYGWDRSERYNDNFKGRDIVEAYERVWMEEFPLYAGQDVYASLGGWHWPGPDDDWHALIDERLIVTTFRDSEPSVEAWSTRQEGFRVIQRIT
ncbi:hypothetical protein Verru16b_03046 [Lacunisphaera limnophila]|uniref:Uncharacterized protein n=1 Tax=Lacunisphaera limnophila TaxID=1838286 RepID=A0A1D8AYK5_9BACT|nr:hypothetical protein [Lacunisphaera limnophila]AOS45955.1 hypothetical protein Verru16b_03046 [Lacunisphaera limnophila]